MFTTIARFFRAWKTYNNAMRELSYLNDRELADIGISRCEIPRLAREHSIAEMALLPTPAPLPGTKPRSGLAHAAPRVRSAAWHKAPAETACLATKLPM